MQICPVPCDVTRSAADAVETGSVAVGIVVTAPGPLHVTTHPYVDHTPLVLGSPPYLIAVQL